MLLSPFGNVVRQLQAAALDFAEGKYAVARPRARGSATPMPAHPARRPGRRRLVPYVGCGRHRPPPPPYPTALRSIASTGDNRAVMPPIYVTGHRNPDADSIAAAIGYAELKGRLDTRNTYTAVRLRPGHPPTRRLPRGGARLVQRPDARAARAERRARAEAPPAHHGPRGRRDANGLPDCRPGRAD